MSTKLTDVVHELVLADPCTAQLLSSGVVNYTALAKSVRNPKYEKTRTTPFWYKPFRNYERFSGTCSKKTLIS
ncbi:hypothetical protein B9Q12_02665 [Candidatus Marsarchaeota G2 archaeon ECH_B_SAG-G06]|uniref:Uncharacterized protein n=1 Tax=Candidatus Marsarchaeota G2 archaeon ECH_B_SAG-G06 TaxID=1978166 RepID=A0A2R6C0B3_9ARCH|nr:MAG: hypothetical protein B9Q12_02665 [Candidatus Marsarchaeota G2 archaeon ECH_B_SAG-G06]